MPQRKLLLSDRWFNRLVVGLVAFGFLLLLGVGFAAFQTVRENQEHTKWVDHTYQVERLLTRFTSVVERAETGRRGYLLSGAPGTLRTYQQARAELFPLLAAVRERTSDNPRQRLNVAQLAQNTNADIKLMDQSIALMQRGGAEAARAQFQEALSLQTMGRVRMAAQAMIAEEDRLLALRDRAQASSLQSFYNTVSLAGILLVVVSGATIWVILRYTQDLTASRAALQKLNANLEGAVHERTTDLQRANDEIQRFAYIVSHDLRSPLVNVMGFTAELEASTKALGKLVDRVEENAPDKLDPEAREAARRDLPEAIGFIRTSTQKMDRLINAILRLSREGRRPITPEPVAMRPLLQGIVDSMKHRVDEIGAEIIVEAGVPDVVSDRLALEQIFSNLIENATKYLKRDVPGRIAVRGRIEAGRAVFEVVDNGRGVDPKDHERIFDLFRRSGVQDQPGEGIGLAHTRALAYRLGGTITVQSSLGEGATFRVSLPKVFTGEQGAMA